MDVQADDISGFHANTHIPVVIGSQMRYEVTGDPLYKVNIFVSLHNHCKLKLPLTESNLSHDVASDSFLE